MFTFFARKGSLLLRGKGLPIGPPRGEERKEEARRRKEEEAEAARKEAEDAAAARKAAADAEVALAAAMELSEGRSDQEGGRRLCCSS